MERLRKRAARWRRMDERTLDSDAYLMFLMLLAMAPVRWMYRRGRGANRGENRICTRRTRLFPHSVAMIMLTGGDMPRNELYCERCERAAYALGMPRRFSRLVGTCSRFGLRWLTCKIAQQIRRDLLMATGLSRARYQ